MEEGRRLRQLDVGTIHSHFALAAEQQQRQMFHPRHCRQQQALLLEGSRQKKQSNMRSSQRSPGCVLDICGCCVVVAATAAVLAVLLTVRK